MIASIVLWVASLSLTHRLGVCSFFPFSGLCKFLQRLHEGLCAMGRVSCGLLFATINELCFSPVKALIVVCCLYVVVLSSDCIGVVNEGLRCLINLVG